MKIQPRQQFKYAQKRRAGYGVNYCPDPGWVRQSMIGKAFIIKLPTLGLTSLFTLINVKRLKSAIFC